MKNTKLLVFISYVILTIIFTYPVAFHLDKIPGGGNDPGWYLWDLWLWKTSLLNFSSPYHTTNIYYPTGVNMAFSSMTPFNAILSIPLQLIFDLVPAYDILWLISFVFAGYGTYLLVLYLIGDKRAAFISGLVFMFSPYHFAEGFIHLNLVTIQWIPFYVLYLFKTIREERKINAIFAGFFLFLIGLSEYQYLVFILTFTLLFFLYNLLTDKKNILKKDTIKRISIMIITFGLIFFPFIYPLLKELILSKSHYMYGGGFERYSADLLAFIVPQKIIFPIGGFLPVFIGYTVLFLTIIALVKIKSKNRKKEINFWLLSTVIFIILALGPVLHVNGKLLEEIKLPYSIIMNVPIISLARVPKRWDVLVTLSFAVLVGYGINYLLEEKFNKKSYKFKKIMITIFLCLILLEYLNIPVPMSETKIPGFYNQLKKDTENYAILEIPDIPHFAGHYMYYQTFHEKELINGYVSRSPPGAEKFMISTPIIDQLTNISTKKIVLENITNEDIIKGKSILKDYNIRYIILHEKYMNKYQINRANHLLQNIFKKQIYKEDKLIVYKVE